MPPRIVLLRPRSAENLGAVARAMKNFGLVDLRVVAPNPLLLSDVGAERLAVGATDLLAAARIESSLAAAVADCSWVVGTTMRRLEGRRRLTPRELSREAALRQDASWALVFGDERHGLTNADLGSCHDVSFIPADTTQPSLNLAQAVVVYAYELTVAGSARRAPPGPILADDAALRALEASLGAALQQAGLLNQGGQRLRDRLMRVLIRARLTKREAGLWSTVLRATARHRP